MENLAFLQDLTNEGITHRKAFLDGSWGSHDDVQRKSGPDALANASRLFGRGPSVPHHNEQIDIGVGSRISRGIRSKHHNALRLKLLNKFPDVLFNLLRSDHDKRSFNVLIAT
jgi:hypothetical protein